MIEQNEKVPKAIWEFEVLKKAIDKWGEAKQLDMMQEEAAELIVAINHYRRGRNTWIHVIEEMSDVRIIIDQFATIGDNSTVMNAERDKKMKRLEEKLK